MNRQIAAPQVVKEMMKAMVNGGIREETWDKEKRSLRDYTTGEISRWKD